jgi:hypothetical protein
VRERDLDPAGVERLLDPAIHLPSDPPLLDGPGRDPTLDDDRRLGKLVYAEDLQRL